MAISCDPNDLAIAATCFADGLSEGQMDAVRTYISCQIVNAGIGTLIYTNGTTDPQSGTWTHTGGTLTEIGFNVFAAGPITVLLCNTKGLDGELDVSSLSSSLVEVSCSDNTLTSLNVSGCASLLYLTCNNNLITALDLSTCVTLTELNCYTNQITSLDVSACAPLTDCYCDGNPITSLTIGSITHLRFFDASNCDLNVTDVNATLIQLDSTVVINGLTDTSGGTSAAPTGAGAAAKASLILSGWSVLTN